ncbi:hypothetical protein N665_1876s0002 [Sinapis alba]|nr:hypothetical protein N665_1876s0002 [Sinapis alba]
MSRMTQVVTPLVNSSVGQGTPNTTPIDNGLGRETVEVVEIDPPTEGGRKVDYLSVLEHISHLGTKHFSSSVDPIEAAEWRSRLVWNFKSTRCPEDYQKDIVVHFLEGDAHNWWLSVEKRTNGNLRESRILRLSSTGRRTVRTYKEEFNRLRRFVGMNLEDEAVQVRRFICGLQVELRTHCSIRTFHIVAELVERMAMLETNLAEESRLRSRTQSTFSSGANDRKRKWDQANEGKSSGGRSTCPKGGKTHPGECWRSMGACVHCGSKEHGTWDCSQPSYRQSKPSNGDIRTCFRCGKSGHLIKDCPQPRTGQGPICGDVGRTIQGRCPTITPRVYELSKKPKD